MATAHVEYAYSPRQGNFSNGTYHLVMNEDLESGRLKRRTHDVLCAPWRKFWGLEPRTDATPNCARCAALAARHGVAVDGPSFAKEGDR